MKKCPSCNKNTIGFWTAIYASHDAPIECSQCNTALIRFRFFSVMAYSCGMLVANGSIIFIFIMQWTAFVLSLGFALSLFIFCNTIETLVFKMKVLDLENNKESQGILSLFGYLIGLTMFIWLFSAWAVTDGWQNF